MGKPVRPNVMEQTKAHPIVIAPAHTPPPDPIAIASTHAPPRDPNGVMPSSPGLASLDAYPGNPPAGNMNRNAVPPLTGPPAFCPLFSCLLIFA